MSNNSVVPAVSTNRQSSAEHNAINGSPRRQSIAADTRRTSISLATPVAHSSSINNGRSQYTGADIIQHAPHFTSGLKSGSSSAGMVPPRHGSSLGEFSQQIQDSNRKSPAATTNSSKASKGGLRYSNYFAEDGSDAIKGPIEPMMMLHYIWYGLLLIVLDASGWTELYYWTLPQYFATAFFVHEINRIIVFLHPLSVLPVILSFIPYCIFHFLCGNAHRIFAICWFVSLMAVNLQIGTERLGRHVLAASTCFMLAYCSLIVFYGFENASSAVITFLPANFNTSDISVMPDGSIYAVDAEGINIQTPQEVTIIVTIWLLGFAFYSLQRFIRKYALSMLDHQNEAIKLTKMNDDLKAQLQTMKKEVKLDLDSPVTKVINLIRNIQDKCRLDAETMENLEYVIDILSSNQLFMPNLNVQGSTMDAEVNRWLNVLVATESKPQNKKVNLSASEIMSSSVLLANQAANVSRINMIEIPKSTVSSASEAKITGALYAMDEWEYDIFALVDATDNQPLYYLGMAIFESYPFKQNFGVDDITLRNFFKRIESGYKNVQYHNSTHAADVMQAIHCFLVTLGLGDLVTMEECFAGLVAGAIHDFEHPGTNNAFLINTSSPLAIRYNDVAVLENYHCSRAFEIITAPNSDCNIFANLPLEKFKQVRSCILSMVLATDMAGHFEYIGKFKNKISGAGLDFNDSKDRQLVLDIAMKCGDISNAAKPQELCLKWTFKIMDEFFLQGEEEKRRGLPISMFMDRANQNIPKCQLGFIDFIVQPLYDVWNTYMNEDGDFLALDYLKRNREYWDAEKQRAEAEARANQATPLLPPPPQVSDSAASSSVKIPISKLP
ncbi:hypothetical protein SmJEL517_g03641 [Synchytrium microbalum]|uniref:Phosphodiesterase n=1 Tax=Synchytrium microbalum TaxID=1806994 RepID=A0A507C606_9FUNG|nr:uncharacterized protein SmJEL517_g03641 [Synchytrium microbalum]TPX33494.1 hypothetical protein SmJEL517_g03641 [Synchytrium microbalum]